MLIFITLDRPQYFPKYPGKYLFTYVINCHVDCLRETSKQDDISRYRHSRSESRSNNFNYFLILGSARVIISSCRSIFSRYFSSRFHGKSPLKIRRIWKMPLHAQKLIYREVEHRPSFILPFCSCFSISAMTFVPLSFVSFLPRFRWDFFTGGSQNGSHFSLAWCVTREFVAPVCLTHSGRIYCHSVESNRDGANADIFTGMEVAVERLI